MVTMYVISKVLHNIKALRENRGLSQYQMSELMGITQSSYARFESGKSKTDLQMVIRFAEAMQMDPFDVLLYPENMQELRSSQNILQASVSISVPRERVDDFMKLVNFPK